MSILVEGIDEVKDEVKAVLETLRNIKSLYPLIEQELEQIAQDSIKNQQSATTNQGYKPLTPTTQELTGKPATPALFSSTLGYQAKVKMTLVGQDEAMISSQLPYAEVHQFGNPNNTLFGRRAPIPARPFLPVRKDGTFTASLKRS